jgi:hypothetical protein
LKGEIITKIQKRLGHLKISRTTWPEKLIFVRKLPDMVQIRVYTNHDPQELEGATVGKRQNYIYMCSF